MANEQALIVTIREQLLAAGWRDSDIIHQPLVRTGNVYARPALVAMIEGYPLASFDVAARDTAAKDRLSETSLPFALESDGVVTRTRHPEEQKHWMPVPRPQDLWEALGREWTPYDPRLAPLIGLRPILHFAQARVLANLLDAIVSGHSRALVYMAVGTGRHLVSLQFEYKMSTSGRARRILLVEESRNLAEQTRKRILTGLGNAPQADATWARRIEVAPRAMLSRDRSSPSSLDEYDPVIIHDATADDDLQSRYPRATIVGFYNGAHPTLAECDHLILLDADDEFLDLYPMYQLLSSPQTRNETHICYLKQRDGQALVGESAHTSIPVELSGFEQFVQLVERLELSDTD